MIDAANANISEAFTPRWNPHLRMACKLIAEGAIGSIQTIDAALCFNISEPEGMYGFRLNSWAARCETLAATPYTRCGS